MILTYCIPVFTNLFIFNTISDSILGSIHMKSAAKIKARELVEKKIESGLS